MRAFSWNRFAYEMRLGRQLCDVHLKAKAHGFRGHQKDGGFKGFLAKQKIPLRKAYRLMDRYQRAKEIMLGEYFDSQEFQNMAAWTKAMKSIDDDDPVTNEKPIDDKNVVTNRQKAVVQ